MMQGESSLNTGDKMSIGRGVRFDRTRRITGYLVGNLDRFNNAKRAEEKDRVKHGTQEIPLITGVSTNELPALAQASHAN